MVALNTNIINFDKKYTGAIVGILNAFFAGSPSVFSALYYNVFTHGDKTDTKNQDFAGFMLLFAIEFAVVDLLCIVFMRIYKDDTPAFVQFENDEGGVNAEKSDVDHKEDVEKFNNGSSSVNGETIPRTSDGPEHPYSEIPLSLKQIFLNVDFQLLIWSISFASAIGLVYANNVTLISKSVGLNAHDDTLTIIIPIANAIISSGIGIFSDYFKARIPRFWVLFSSYVFFTASQVLVLLFATSYGMLIMSLIFVACGISILWTISPTLIKEWFYVGNLGRNWGIGMLLAALIGAGMQEAFGALYDHVSSGSADDLHCEGMKCIRGGTALVIAGGGTSIVLAIVLLVKQKIMSVRSIS